jgi:hypothetical protein
MMMFRILSNQRRHLQRLDKHRSLQIHPNLSHANRLFAVFVCLQMASTSVSGKNQLKLATLDTVLTLSAEPRAPRILSLSGSNGFTWKNTQPERLVEKVLVNGRWEAIQWKLESAKADPLQNRVIAVYLSSHPHLRLHWEWQARDRLGPIEHSIRIDNLESVTVGLPLQESFTLNWKIANAEPLRHLWIEKGAGKPSPVGTHDVPALDHYSWEGTSSTYAKDRPDGEWEPIPWMLVETIDKEQSGWYLGIEFSGRTYLSLSREGPYLEGEAGLNPLPGPYLTQVAAGGSFTTPTIFLGAFAGGSEAAGNILRRWIRHSLLNPATLKNPSYPLLVNNSWGNGMEINEAKAQAMIDDAASLDLEMFHMDAGWFRGVGDWYSNLAKFPHGIDGLSDYVHRVGMKFGLWVDWTQAGTDSATGALNVHDPATRDWLTRDVPADWKPEPFKGVTIDIGYPAAKTWCARELDRLVKDFHLDMLEHDGYLVAEGCTRTDHPHTSCDGSPLGQEPWLEGSCSTDVSYHATLVYYDLYEKLRRQHPGLLLEACNDGGRMVDFGTAAHTDYFSITDTYDPLSNRRAFYDASHVLPAPMLECYVERYNTPHLANFVYALRSGMMGWCTIMQDTTSWTPEQHGAAKQAFDLYKSKLRPLIREADLYHISPRPDGVHWDGLEYFQPNAGQGVVYAFRGSTPEVGEYTFLLKGLQPTGRYNLHFEDRTSPDRTATGKELMTSGLTVSLTLPESSELVFISKSTER